MLRKLTVAVLAIITIQTSISALAYAEGQQSRDPVVAEDPTANGNSCGLVRKYCIDACKDAFKFNPVKLIECIYLCNSEVYVECVSGTGQFGLVLP